MLNLKTEDHYNSLQKDQTPAKIKCRAGSMEEVLNESVVSARTRDHMKHQPITRKKFTSVVGDIFLRQNILTHLKLFVRLNVSCSHRY